MWCYSLFTWRRWIWFFKNRFCRLRQNLYRPWPEGSSELGICHSILRFFHLSFFPAVFLELAHLFFSWDLVRCQGPIWRCLWQSSIFELKCSKSLKNLFIGFAWKWCRMKVIMTFKFSIKIAYVGKIWFSSYDQKCSRPFRFWYSLIVNMSLMDWHLTLIFCM